MRQNINMKVCEQNCTCAEFAFINRTLSKHVVERSGDVATVDVSSLHESTPESDLDRLVSISAFKFDE